MKTLSTEQQQDLQALIIKAADNIEDQDIAADLAYWAQELKPKRVRKKDILDLTTPENVI